LSARVRGAAFFLVAAAILAAVSDCEVAFPFDRDLIPEEAGVVSDVDSGSFSEDATLPGEDAQEDAPAVRDAGTDSSMALDGSTNRDAAEDGSQDSAGSVDAAADVVVAPDAMVDAGEDAE
jgi:hypothetical protein